MSRRIEQDVCRGRTLTIHVDDKPVATFEGETVATALLMADVTGLRLDTDGKPRGLFCNMGTCSECFVELERRGVTARRVRACLVAVEDGMMVRTGTGAHD